MTTFAEDLAAGRREQEDRADPAWCVLRVVANDYSLETDPLDERGYKGPWYRADGALDLAARVLYHGAGLTQRAVSERLGIGGTAIRNTRPDVPLYGDELDALYAAEDLHGGPLSD